MWNSLVSLAAQAKAAAEHLEDSINVSVGASAPNNNNNNNSNKSNSTAAAGGSMLGTFLVDASVDLWDESAVSARDEVYNVEEDDTAISYTPDHDAAFLGDTHGSNEDTHETHGAYNTTEFDTQDMHVYSGLHDTHLEEFNNFPSAGENAIHSTHDSNCDTSNQTQPARVDMKTHPNRDNDCKPEELSTQIQETHLSESFILQLQAQVENLEEQLLAREAQLTANAELMSTMMDTHTKEKESLLSQVRETKDEAKKRILLAKERVAEMQQHVQRLELAAATNQTTASHDAEKDLLIQTLRSEGENMAKRMSEIEQRAKETRLQSLDLKEELASQTAIKEKLETKVADLELELKTIRNKWTQAQQGEIRAEQLETNVLTMKEEAEIKQTKIISLETDLKELKLVITSLKQENQDLMRSKDSEAQAELTKWKKEKKEWIDEFEQKMRDVQQEAHDREETLRKEVAELRKRWQDAVQRADAMSMDMQLASAPLMRQLESAERQNRMRANAWAELEARLRHENEELISVNNNVIKEKNDLVVTIKRLERHLTDKEDEISKARKELDEVQNLNLGLESKVDGLQRQMAVSNKEHSDMIKSLKEYEAKIRTDMTKLLRDNEVKYQNELELERQARTQLERKIEELLSLSTSAQSNTGMSKDPTSVEPPKYRKPKLTAKDDQASILKSAIVGLALVEDDDDATWMDQSEELKTSVNSSSMATVASYAYTEQLLQGLKVAKLELDTLRSQFNDSEATKENLLLELSRCKDAGDRLPAIEKNFKILEAELKEKNLELQGLREDIAEVRSLYRSQLDALIEEKTHAVHHSAPSKSKESMERNMIYGADDLASIFLIDEPRRAIYEKAMQKDTRKKKKEEKKADLAAINIIRSEASNSLKRKKDGAALNTSISITSQTSNSSSAFTPLQPALSIVPSSATSVASTARGPSPASIDSLLNNTLLSMQKGAGNEYLGIYRRDVAQNMSTYLLSKKRPLLFA